MSMQTDQYGNQGHWLQKGTTDVCQADPTKINEQCYFSTDIRGTGSMSGYGQGIHTLQQEQGTDSLGLPDAQHTMWTEYDLQNKCPTDDINTCAENANCGLNQQFFVRERSLDGTYCEGIGCDNKGEIYNYLKNTYKGGIKQEDPYWVGKWDQVEEADVCNWEGIQCQTIFDQDGRYESSDRTYITNVDIPDRYFTNPIATPTYCLDSNKTLSQEEWVSKQQQYCSDLKVDRACSDNQFCEWTDEKPRCWNVTDDGDHPTSYNIEQCETHENHKWKVGTSAIPTTPDNYEYYKHFYSFDNTNNGTCSLDNNYDVKGGLNVEDEFKTKTMSDVLGDINNGRVPDVDIFDNVTLTSKGDVTMEQDNQTTAIKGIVEETALSTIYLSEQNTKVLHDTIRYEVYKMTNIVVDYQSDKDLYIIMRSILLQHGNFKVSGQDLLYEIHKLNKLVVSYSAKEVASNVLQYKGYISDLENLPIPVDRPSFTERTRMEPLDFSSRNNL
jgi:hypothetical protein